MTNKLSGCEYRADTLKEVFEVIEKVQEAEKTEVEYCDNCGETLDTVYKKYSVSRLPCDIDSANKIAKAIAGTYYG